MANRPPLYPGNSDIDKQQIVPTTALPEAQPSATTPAPAASREPIKKLATGAVSLKKKTPADSFAAVFFSEKVKSVGTYILYDVLIPAAKDTIASMVKSGIEMLMYGEARRDNIRRDRERSSIVPYNRYYDERERRPERRDEPQRIDLHSRYEFDEYIFARRADAEEVLSFLSDVLQQYDTVSVADFFEKSNLKSYHVDRKYGWDRLGSAAVVPVRGGYIVDLPKPIVIE